MRVNVIHPVFLSDQHLVAEYREVKMGPKALSRSLGSLKGVDRNRISPVYTLNTGHTYFFYDKNTFLEKRLALLVEEMQYRGFQTNHLELLDDSYDYHPRTFDSEWWGDWEPNIDAVNINMERINERFFQKSLSVETKGWYKLFGYSVPDMGVLFNSRKNGFIHICPHCKSINENLQEDIFCWYCCKKILIGSMEKISLTKREQKIIPEQKEDLKVPLVIIKARSLEADYTDWNHLRLYQDWLGKTTGYDIQEELKVLIKFINTKLNLEYKNLEEQEEIERLDYDEFDLEDLGNIIKILCDQISNRKEILNLIISIIRLEQDKVFFREYFKKDLE